MKPSAIYHNLKNLSKRNTITLLNRMTEAPPPLPPPCFKNT